MGSVITLPNGISIESDEDYGPNIMEMQEQAMSDDEDDMEYDSDDYYEDDPESIEEEIENPNPQGGEESYYIINEYSIESIFEAANLISQEAYSTGGILSFLPRNHLSDNELGKTVRILEERARRDAANEEKKRLAANIYKEGKGAATTLYSDSKTGLGKIGRGVKDLLKDPFGKNKRLTEATKKKAKIVKYGALGAAGLGATALGALALKKKMQDDDI